MEERCVVVDHRESAAELARLLIEEHGFAVVFDTLPLGDYRVGGTTLIERKTTRDFALSVVDGRLFDQAYRLACSPADTLMVIEGASLRTDVAVDRDALQGALITLAQTFRLPVLRTGDEAGTAWTIARLYEQRLRLGRKRGPLRGPGRGSADLAKLRVVCAVPGVGESTARRLLARFGGVAALASASRRELLDVPGIGPQRADRIRDTLMEGAGEWRL